MNQKEKVETALYAIDKSLDYETLYYCDEMYGKEDQTDDVWEFVCEAKEIGLSYFKDKYSIE